MPQNCTILCQVDDPVRILAVLRELVHEDAQLRIKGKEDNWSSITITNSNASLTLNRQIQRKPGDSFSSMVLGMYNYFNRVKTSAKAIKKDVLNRVANSGLAIGVVAEPEFMDTAGHYDCIFGIAAASDAIIWTGSGVINTEGKMLLDGEGNSEVA